MKKDTINLIYLLGAGRSGTTLLATLLNSCSSVVTVGEMHQFYEHLLENKPCSCGKKLGSCFVWSSIVKAIDQSGLSLENALQTTEEVEKHYNIPKEILINKQNEAYQKLQEKAFEALGKENPDKYLVDSSKYIARYLQLKKNKKYNIKGVYLVRDVRGVVNSFGKQVQTPKKPLAALIYYNLINFWGELITRFDKNIVKIRYEDLIEYPEQTLKTILTHVFGTEKDVKLPKEYTVPHIVGGNRMKKKKSIMVKPDYSWKRKIKRWKQKMYYIFSWPFMLVNRYRI